MDTDPLSDDERLALYLDTHPACETCGERTDVVGSINDLTYCIPCGVAVVDEYLAEMADPTRTAEMPALSMAQVASGVRS